MTGPEFEAEVLRIARAMWPSAKQGGPGVVAQQERDGIFITEDQVALIEATVERTKVKAQKDGKKLNELARRYGRRYPMHAVRAWFITLEEPTADQRDAIRALGNDAVVAVSFNQFRSHLVDAAGYLDARAEHQFGSARGLDDDGSYREPGEYVPLDILEKGSDGRLWTVGAIVDALLEGKRLALLGDFGAGKSMTVREVFFELHRRFQEKHTSCFPIHLNLREHLGQSDPSEALHRHARTVGFDSPAQLVRAWKSGYGMLLLDGFDEMAATTWSGEPERVREARRRAVRIVREMLQNTPVGSGVLVAGREHYFDNDEERASSLGYSSMTPELSLNDFTDEQVQGFLKTKSIPTWLPRRPYLLGYLAARGLLPDDAEQCTPAEGWDRLLDGLSEREAQIEAGIEGATVRRILERLASFARATDDGLGPVNFDQISRAFREVVGYSPDENALMLLQRLPGLGVADPVTGTRRVIDGSLADAIGAGDPFAFACDPYAAAAVSEPGAWTMALGTLGTEVLAQRIEQVGVPFGARRRAIEHAVHEGWSTLAFDLIRALDASGEGLEGGQVPIEGIWVDELSIGYSEASFAALQLAESVVQSLDINPPISESRIPLFRNCHFGSVSGVSGEPDLPATRFIDCQFESFSEATTNTSAILKLRLPLGTRVGLTILKKLYLQRGTGRKESALRRGLDERAKATVDAVLDVLQGADLTVPATVGRQLIWLPVRGQHARVHAILASPMASQDPLMERLAGVV